MTNIWSIDIVPGKKMTYNLNREGRNFVAEFDLRVIRPESTLRSPQNRHLCSRLHNLCYFKGELKRASSDY